MRDAHCSMFTKGRLTPMRCDVAHRIADTLEIHQGVRRKSAVSKWIGLFH